MYLLIGTKFRGLDQVDHSPLLAPATMSRKDGGKASIDNAMLNIYARLTSNMLRLLWLRHASLEGFTGVTFT